MTVPVSQIGKRSLTEQVPGLVTQRDLNSDLADRKGKAQTSYCCLLHLITCWILLLLVSPLVVIATIPVTPTPSHLTLPGVWLWLRSSGPCVIYTTAWWSRHRVSALHLCGPMASCPHHSPEDPHLCNNKCCVGLAWFPRWSMFLCDLKWRLASNLLPSLPIGGRGTLKPEATTPLTLGSNACRGRSTQF